MVEFFFAVCRGVNSFQKWAVAVIAICTAKARDRTQSTNCFKLLFAVHSALPHLMCRSCTTVIADLEIFRAELFGVIFVYIPAGWYGAYGADLSFLITTAGNSSAAVATASCKPVIVPTSLTLMLLLSMTFASNLVS